MGMGIYKARQDIAAGGVYHLCIRSGYFIAYCGYNVPVYEHIRPPAAIRVYYGSVFDDGLHMLSSEYYIYDVKCYDKQKAPAICPLFGQCGAHSGPE